MCLRANNQDTLQGKDLFVWGALRGVIETRQYQLQKAQYCKSFLFTIVAPTLCATCVVLLFLVWGHFNEDNAISEWTFITIFVILLIANIVAAKKILSWDQAKCKARTHECFTSTVDDFELPCDYSASFLDCSNNPDVVFVVLRRCEDMDDSNDVLPCSRIHKGSVNVSAFLASPPGTGTEHEGLDIWTWGALKLRLDDTILQYQRIHKLVILAAIMFVWIPSFILVFVFGPKVLMVCLVLLAAVAVVYRVYEEWRINPTRHVRCQACVDDLGPAIREHSRYQVSYHVVRTWYGTTYGVLHFDRNEENVSNDVEQRIV